MNVSGPLIWWPIAVATLAALAALFSAATAFLTLRLNLVNQREAARPDLVIEEYDLHKRSYAPTTRPTVAAITFPLRNIGRGPALNTRIAGHFDSKDDIDPNPIGRVRPIIPAGEDSPLINTVEFFWPSSSDIFAIEVLLYCSDIYGDWYETTYRFLIQEFDGEGSVDGHAIDIVNRRNRRIPSREAPKVLENVKPSHVRFAPVPMAYYFDLAHQELEAEKGEEDPPSAAQ